MKKIIGPILGIIISPIAYANIDCLTPGQLRAFQIRDGKIIIIEKEIKHVISISERALSSEDPIESNTLTKNFEFEGREYRLYIKRIHTHHPICRKTMRIVSLKI